MAVSVPNDPLDGTGVPEIVQVPVSDLINQR